MKKTILSFLALAISSTVFASNAVYTFKTPLAGGSFSGNSAPVTQPAAPLPDNWIAAPNLYLTDWAVSSSNCLWSQVDLAANQSYVQTRTCNIVDTRSYQKREINTATGAYRIVTTTRPNGVVISTRTEIRERTDSTETRSLDCFYDRGANKNYLVSVLNNSFTEISRNVYFNNSSLSLTFSQNSENRGIQEASDGNGKLFLLSQQATENVIVNEGTPQFSLTQYFSVCKTK